jgi:hypothetical protein
MRRSFPTILVIICALISMRSGSAKEKLQKNSAPLSAEEVAIYRAVLQQYVSDKSGGTINVSIQTFPLDPDSPTSGLSRGGCLEGIQVDDLSTRSHSYHELTHDVLPSKNMTLVDPRRQAKIVRNNDPDTTIAQGEPVHSAVEKAFSTGLFSLSEIAFDKSHHYAIVSYRFWCGSLCGHGSTLIFENISGQWKRTDRKCGGWVS